MKRSNFYFGIEVIISLLLCITFFSASAISAEYPSRPVEIVTHSAPGGPNNLIAQMMVDIFQKEKILSQPMYVTLKPGSGMAKGFSYLFEKKGEDHLWAITSSGLIVGTPMRVEVPYNYKTFTPIANLCVDGSVLIVNAKGPYKTMDDLIDAAKKNPNKLSQGGSSITSNEAMIGKVMQEIKGVQWKFVSFKGELEAATNVMGGIIDFAILNPSSVLEHVRAGNLRVILASSTKRYKAFPDVPTIPEAGLGVAQVSYRLMIGPPDMPSYAAKALEGAAKKFVASEPFQKYLDQQMMQEEYMDAKQLSACLDENAKFIKQQMIDGGMLNPDGSIKKK